MFWGLPAFFWPPSAHLQGPFTPTSSQHHLGKCPPAQGPGPGQCVSYPSRCLGPAGNQDPLGREGSSGSPCPAVGWLHSPPQGQREGQVLGTRDSAVRVASPNHPSGSNTIQGLHQPLPGVTDLPAQERRDVAAAPARLGTQVVAQLAPWQPAPGWCSLTSTFCCPQHLCPCTGAPGAGSSTHRMHSPRGDRGVPGVAPSTSPSPRDSTDLLNPCLRWRSSGHS